MDLANGRSCGFISWQAQALDWAGRGTGWLFSLFLLSQGLCSDEASLHSFSSKVARFLCGSSGDPWAQKQDFLHVPTENRHDISSTTFCRLERLQSQLKVKGRGLNKGKYWEMWSIRLNWIPTTFVTLVFFPLSSTLVPPTLEASVSSFVYIYVQSFSVDCFSTFSYHSTAFMLYSWSSLLVKRGFLFCGLVNWLIASCRHYSSGHQSLQLRCFIYRHFFVLLFILFCSLIIAGSLVKRKTRHYYSEGHHPWIHLNTLPF